jgi:hypothetical protein
MVFEGVNWIHLSQNSVHKRDSCEQGNDSFGSIKNGKFLDNVRDYQLLKDQSVDKCTEKNCRVIIC